MRVEREEEDRREREDFESRNRRLWDGIESTISSSEAAHLSALKKRQEEEAIRAAAMRASEEDKQRLIKEEQTRREEEAKRQEAESIRAQEQAAKDKVGKEERQRMQKDERGGLGGLESKGQEFGEWVEKMKVCNWFLPWCCLFLCLTCFLSIHLAIITDDPFLVFFFFLLRLPAHCSSSSQTFCPKSTVHPNGERSATLSSVKLPPRLVKSSTRNPSFCALFVAPSLPQHI